MQRFFQARAYGAVMAAALWLALAGMAMAANVGNESGDASPGSFRDIVGSSGIDESIGFDPGVNTIVLQAAATSGISGLQITGDGATFAAELAAILAQEWTDQAALQGAVAAMTLPGVTLDGGNSAPRLLKLTVTSGNAATLDGLVFRDARQEYRSPDDDKSLGGGFAWTAVESSNLTGGGAVYMAGGGNIQKSAFISNNLSIAAGDATAGGNTTEASAVAVVNARGGGAYMVTGTITSSLFIADTATAIGGTAHGGDNVTSSLSFAYAYASANATVNGGGAYLGIGMIASSVFMENNAIAYGGAALAGSHITATVTNGDASAAAYAGANAYGGGAYLSFGTITSSLFVANSATAYGGEAIAGNHVSTSAGTYPDTYREPLKTSKRAEGFSLKMDRK